jgi:hypothetical protein
VGHCDGDGGGFDEKINYLSFILLFQFFCKGKIGMRKKRS